MTLMNKPRNFWGDKATSPTVKNSGEYGSREISARAFVRGLYWWTAWLLTPLCVRFFGVKYGSFLPIAGIETGGKWYCRVLFFKHTFTVPYRFLQ